MLLSGTIYQMGDDGKDIKMRKLYIWIRSDLESMTPGKAAAQVAHAASQAARVLANDSSYRAWENEPINMAINMTSSYPDLGYSHFGTTIVLDGGSGDDLESLYFTELQPLYPSRSGFIVDPTYPIRDGRKTFYLNVPTCAWTFYDPAISDCARMAILSRFSLYNGNQI